MSIESKILDYMCGAYLIYSASGELQRQHERIAQIFWGSKLSEETLSSFTSFIKFIEKHKLQTIEGIEDIFRDENQRLSEDVEFSTLVSIGESVFFAQILNLEKEARAILFSDVTMQYKLLQEEKYAIDTCAQDFQRRKMESLGVLAGGMAHDFNNILSVIDGYSRLISMKVNQSDPFADHLQHIIDSVQQGAALTHQVLTFAKKQKEVFEIVDLQQFFEQKLPIFQALVPEDIDLAIKISPESCINIVPDYLSQILINLIVNARDAISNHHGRIVISSHTKEKSCTLSVSDDGVGMDAETRDKLYIPYYTTKKNGIGIGMGKCLVLG